MNKILKREDLKEITEKDGSLILNGCLEILRKNVVSDKSNAFNKIFNLLLAKSYDEKHPAGGGELRFQTSEDEIEYPQRLFSRLDYLYSSAMQEYMGIKCSHYNMDSPYLMYSDTFAFLEPYMYPVASNTKIVREMVELLQYYKFCNNTNQQYLSDFFELFLNKGFKQEAGQFFTPVPIARFILRSLPINKFITDDNKIPYIIDYASGSGHFISEAVQELKAYINNENIDVANNVYGIEKDYRLAKSAKVACCLQGNESVKIICGDGLDSFEKSKRYDDILKANAKEPQFDIVIANPPFSVGDIKYNLQYLNSHTDFSLYEVLTDKSSEIECLFIERTVQLLKEGGVAGIILPNTILFHSGKVFTKAREIILQYFNIIAIVELGSSTFMDTNTYTDILFLRKRNSKQLEEIKFNAFNKDCFVLDVVKEYLEYTGDKEISIKNLEKFYYYLLIKEQQVVVVKTGGGWGKSTEAEKRFLGYEFSKRRGSAGIRPYGGETIEECTKLYNSIDDSDNTKASFYIRKAFEGKYSEIEESLKGNIFYVNLVDMIKFNNDKFDKSMNINKAIDAISNE